MTCKFNPHGIPARITRSLSKANNNASTDGVAGTDDTSVVHETNTRTRSEVTNIPLSEDSVDRKTYFSNMAVLDAGEKKSEKNWFIGFVIAFVLTVICMWVGLDSGTWIIPVTTGLIMTSVPVIFPLSPWDREQARAYKRIQTMSERNNKEITMRIHQERAEFNEQMERL